MLAILTDDDEEALLRTSSPTVCIMQVVGRQRDGEMSVTREGRRAVSTDAEIGLHVAFAPPFRELPIMGSSRRSVTRRVRSVMERLYLQLEPDLRPPSIPRLWALAPTGRVAARMGVW